MAGVGQLPRLPRRGARRHARRAEASLRDSRRPAHDRADDASDGIHEQLRRMARPARAARGRERLGAGARLGLVPRWTGKSEPAGSRRRRIRGRRIGHRLRRPGVPSARPSGVRLFGCVDRAGHRRRTRDRGPVENDRKRRRKRNEESRSACVAAGDSRILEAGLLPWRSGVGLHHSRHVSARHGEADRFRLALVRVGLAGVRCGRSGLDASCGPHGASHVLSIAMDPEPS